MINSNFPEPLEALSINQPLGPKPRPLIIQQLKWSCPAWQDPQGPTSRLNLLGLASAPAKPACRHHLVEPVGAGRHIHILPCPWELSLTPSPTKSTVPGHTTISNSPEAGGLASRAVFLSQAQSLGRCSQPHSKQNQLAHSPGTFPGSPAPALGDRADRGGAQGPCSLCRTQWPLHLPNFPHLAPAGND